MSEAASEAGGWQGTYEVVLTPEEVAQILATARSHAGRAKGGNGGLLAAGSVVAAFGLALLLVLNGTVPAERAGLVAVGGFLAYWAGVSTYFRVAHRAARREQMAAWRAIGGRYSVTLDAAGLTWSIAGRSTRTAWWRMRRAQDVGGSVLLWTVWRSLLFLPARVLPAEWPASRLVPQVNGCIRDARDREGLRAGEGLVAPP